MTHSRGATVARIATAFLVVAAVFGPAQLFGAQSATACPAQRIGSTPAWNRGNCTTPSTIPPLSRSAYAEIDLLTRVNAERSARGIAPLHYDARLTVFARDWSAAMASTSFHHSDIRRLFEGRFNLVGENIAWASGSGATAGLLHKMWMQSSGHRQNMLSPGFDAIGIGVFCGPDGSMWATQNFGRHSSLGGAAVGGVPPANPLVRGDAGVFSCS